MNRTERLLDLIAYLLNAHEPVSWQEIKNHFPEDYAQGIEESNQRKFERDKAELITLGIPIDYYGGSEFKKEGYIIDKEKLFLPEIEFTPQEASLLMLSSNAVLEHEGFPYSDQLESALHKIISVDHQINPPPAPRELGISYPDSKQVGPRSAWVRQIQDGLDRRKFVEIRYHAFSTGEVTARKVNPYGLIFRKGVWTLVAWDHLRKDIRHFVLSRILDLEVNPRRPGTPDYEIEEGFSLPAYRNQQPWELRFHPPLQVTLRVSSHRLPELLPQLSDAESVDRQTFKVRVTNRHGLIRWVLFQKSDVEVLAPASVRTEIRETLGRLL